MNRLFFTKKPSDTIADIIHDKNKQELCLKQRRCEKNNRKKRVLGKKNTKNRKNQHDQHALVAAKILAHQNHEDGEQGHQKSCSYHFFVSLIQGRYRSPFRGISPQAVQPSLHYTKKSLSFQFASAPPGACLHNFHEPYV